jgi:hypothetical protein
VIIAHKFICGKIVLKYPSSPKGTNENGVSAMSQSQFFQSSLVADGAIGATPRGAGLNLEFGVYLIPTINCWDILILSPAGVAFGTRYVTSFLLLLNLMT